MLPTSDLEIVFNPFLRLQDTRHLEIKHPFGGKNRVLDFLLSDMMHKAVSTIPLDRDLNDDDGVDDEMILTNEGTWTVWFDYIL